MNMCSQKPTQKRVLLLFYLPQNPLILKEEHNRNRFLKTLPGHAKVIRIPILYADMNCVCNPTG